MSLDPDKPFHDGDAPTIDKAIASSVIADYVSGKLQTLADHFQTAEPNQFAYLYNKWGESKLPVEDVPGFTDRKDKEKPIKREVSAHWRALVRKRCCGMRFLKLLSMRRFI